MACPPVSALSCREDQFLVEVRGEKPCCYSYLCGMFVTAFLTNIKKRAWGWLLAFIFDSLTTTQAEINLWFVPFVWAVCESCIEPIPTCSHGEILAVDFNNTNSCCPQYHCGKWKECVWVSVSPSSMSCVQRLPCVAVCDVNLCPESSVSCAPGLTLVQTTQPGSCCPQHHCGTHSLTFIHALIHCHTQWEHTRYSRCISVLYWDDDWDNQSIC